MTFNAEGASGTKMISDNSTNLKQQVKKCKQTEETYKIIPVYSEPEKFSNKIIPVYSEPQKSSMKPSSTKLNTSINDVTYVTSKNDGYPSLHIEEKYYADSDIVNSYLHSCNLIENSTKLIETVPTKSTELIEINMEENIKLEILDHNEQYKMVSNYNFFSFTC